MAKVPADLHIHLDNDVTKERVIKILKSAEENGLKAICLLEHNNINFYKRGGVLEELLIEGIEKYYAGKIVTGVELNCTIKNAPVSKKTGIDYNGYDIHVAYYGFNPKDLKKRVDWFNEEVDAVRYYQDVDSLCSNLRRLNLPEPPKSIFRFAEGVKPFKQLYSYIQTSPEKDKYTQVLGEYPHPSAFVRNLAYDPHSIIYFDRAQSPSIVDIINVGKECAKFQCISYPYHINRKLIKDVADYIDTLEAIPTKTSTKNFNCVEGAYMLNTDEETKSIEELAKARGLFVSAGSDYQPQDKMYYLPPDATEKLWYAPAPGLYVRQLFDGGLGLLTIDEELLNILPDVREYKIYRTSAPQKTVIDNGKKPQEEPIEKPHTEVFSGNVTAELNAEEKLEQPQPAEQIKETTTEKTQSAQPVETVKDASKEIAQEVENTSTQEVESEPVTLPLDNEEYPVETVEQTTAEVTASEVSEEPKTKSVEKKKESTPKPKKAPAKKPASPKSKQAEKKAEKPAENKSSDDLDDTLSLLEQLTNDME